jgi:hypothetical protein
VERLLSRTSFLPLRAALRRKLTIRWPIIKSDVGYVELRAVAFSADKIAIDVLDCDMAGIVCRAVNWAA